MLRWKTAKIEVVMNEAEEPGSAGGHTARDVEGAGGGIQPRDDGPGMEDSGRGGGGARCWDRGSGDEGPGGYAEEVVRERERVGDVGLGIRMPLAGGVGVEGGGGVRGYEYVVSDGAGEGRVERREREREGERDMEGGLKGYGYVTDVGARWF